MALLLALFLSAASLARIAAQSAPEELQQRASSSKDKVFRLKDESYNQFVRNSVPRKYGLLVFFDAAQLRDNRQLNLPGLRNDFGFVAKTVTKNLEGGAGPPIFFADIEFQQSEETFRREKIQSLPHIRYFGAGEDTKGVEMDFSRYPRSWQGLASFLKSAAKQDVGSVEPPPALSKQQMALIAIAVVVAAPFVATRLLTTKTLLHDSRVWCLGGLAVYLFSVSGGMFNIIRGMPMYVPDQKHPGRFVYFLQQGGNQFGAEGFTIGTFYTAVGLAIAFVTFVLPKVPSVAAKRLFGMIAIGICAFAVRKVVDFEVWKQGYWVHGFWPSSWK